jgi:glutamate synthase (NADPH/NADH) small chain
VAKQPMLKFVTVGKEMPEKRDAKRTGDFDEIYGEYAREKAAEQAGRCSQCGVPYCQSHCPLHNNIPDWLKLTAEGRCGRPMTSARRPTPSPRSAAASVRRTGCAKAIA